MAKYLQTNANPKESVKPPEPTLSSSPIATKRSKPTEASSAKKSKPDEHAQEPLSVSVKDKKIAVAKLKPIKIRQVVVAGTKTVVMAQQPGTSKKVDEASKTSTESATLSQKPILEESRKPSEDGTSMESPGNNKKTLSDNTEAIDKTGVNSADAEAAKKEKYEELKKRFQMRRAADKIIKIIPRTMKVVRAINTSLELKAHISRSI